MSKSSFRATLGWSLVALLSIPAALLYTQNAISQLPEPERQVPVQQVPRVTVVDLQADTHQSLIQAFGDVRTVDQVQLSSQVAGRVIWRNPKLVAGGRIDKGEELVHVDDTAFRVALANARQTLAEAKLALQQEQRQQRQARQDWQRSGLSEQPSALVLRDPQLAVAKARHNAAKVAVSEAKKNLAQTRIKAPFAAVIVDRQVALGSYLNPGSAVATLSASRRAEVSLALSARQWRQLPAQLQKHPVRLISQHNTAERWQGEVKRLSASIDANTRLRTLVVAVQDPLDQNPPLRFGSFVGVQLPGAALEDVFALPSSALTADGYLWYVQNGQLQRIRREPLFSADGQIYVARESLPQQLRVVRKPLASYLEGMRVKAVTPEARS